MRIQIRCVVAALAATLLFACARGGRLDLRLDEQPTNVLQGRLSVRLPVGATPVEESTRPVSADDAWMDRYVVDIGGRTLELAFYEAFEHVSGEPGALFQSTATLARPADGVEDLGAINGMQVVFIEGIRTSPSDDGTPVGQFRVRPSDGWVVALDVAVLPSARSTPRYRAVAEHLLSGVQPGPRPLRAGPRTAHVHSLESGRVELEIPEGIWGTTSKSEAMGLWSTGLGFNAPGPQAWANVDVADSAFAQSLGLVTGSSEERADLLLGQEVTWRIQSFEFGTMEKVLVAHPGDATLRIVVSVVGPDADGRERLRDAIRTMSYVPR